MPHDEKGHPGVWWCKTHDREATHSPGKGLWECSPGLPGIKTPCFVTFKPDPPKPGDVERCVADLLCKLMKVGSAVCDLRNFDPRALHRYATQLEKEGDIFGPSIIELLSDCRAILDRESPIKMTPTESTWVLSFLATWCPCKQHRKMRDEG